jgi:hypothetical protein
MTVGQIPGVAGDRPCHQTGRAEFPHRHSDWFRRGHTVSNRYERHPYQRCAFDPRYSSLGRFLILSSGARRMANHPSLTLFESAPESGFFPPPALPRVLQYYAPVRLSAGSPPSATSRRLPSPKMRLPLSGSPYRRAGTKERAGERRAARSCRKLAIKSLTRADWLVGLDCNLQFCTFGRY